MTPQARIDAAARAAFVWDYAQGGPFGDQTWEGISEGERDWYRSIVSEALHAADDVGTRGVEPSYEGLVEVNRRIVAQHDATFYELTAALGIIRDLLDSPGYEAHIEAADAARLFLSGVVHS